MRYGRRFALSVLCALVLLASGGPWFGLAGAVHALGPRLFFSEYVEGSGNNQALEIYNGTGAAIDLGAGGYKIQFYFDGSASPGVTLNLSGEVADGGVHVVARSSAAASILEQADQTFSGTWFDGNDAVVLRKGNVRLDVIGQIGFNPGSEWGSEWDGTADSTLRRNYCEGDPNGSNRFSPIGWWQSYAMDTFDGLGAHSADCVSFPVPLPVLYAGVAVMLVGLAVGVTRWTGRRGVKLGILGTFLKWLAVYVLLMPLAEFIAARGDARTMVLAATAELAAIALVAGVAIGWTQRDRMEGALQWIAVIMVSYVPVALSSADAGSRLSDLEGFSEWGVVGLSLVLYEAAFFVTNYLRRRGE